MPFGKRVGSKFENKTLYPKTFEQFARVLKPGGLAVILCGNPNLLQRSVVKSLWAIVRIQK